MSKNINYTDFTLIDQSAERGFTLIELSIVLVIIGLIVGGVLVGQDLIKAAQIRATVAQIEKYNTAADTFRNKYNGIPGDLLNPTNYFTGLTGATTTNAIGCGDGDNLVTAISACGTAITTGDISGESVVFWYELQQAGLIGDSINAADGTFTAYNKDASSANQTYLPTAKLGGANVIGVNSFENFNYFLIHGVSGAASSGSLASASANYLTVTQAYNIDAKADDGLPSSGTIFSTGSADVSKNASPIGSGSASGTPANSNGVAGGSATACWNSSNNTYALSFNNGANQNCQLMIRAAF